MSRIVPAYRRLRRNVLPGLGLLAVLAISLWLAWNSWERAVPTDFLTLTGGRSPGTKHQLAEVLARESPGTGVRLTIQECSGSVEALDRVNEGLVDVALVQGGLDSKRWADVRQVAALHVEPLQLVVRGEFFAEVGATLRALKGRTVNLGEVGSGSELLTREVLDFVGLRSGNPGDFVPVSLSQQQLLEIQDRERLPDAVITVASSPRR